VLSAFREYFVKTDLFFADDSNAYGEAFELRNISDYEMLGDVDVDQARMVIDSATQFGQRSENYLQENNFL